MNILTKGTETLAKHTIPINEDACVIGKIQGVSSSLIQFTKVFDTGETKMLYAIPRYNGRTQAVKTEHLPVVGSFARFYRVGDYNSQGSEGFELHTENAGKASFVWFADYREEESTPSPTVPKFYDIYFSVASWRESNLSDRTQPETTRIFWNNQYYNGHSIFFLNRQGSAFKLLPTLNGEITKDFRFASSQSASIDFFSGYDGNGNYSGLLFSHNRCVLYNQFASSPTVFVENVRYNTKVKSQLATIDWHPYDDPPFVYIRITEYLKLSVVANLFVSTYSEITTGWPAQRVRDEIGFTISVKENGTKIGNLDVDVHTHYKDQYAFDGRLEKNPIKIVDDGIWTNPNSPPLTDQSTGTIPLTSRYSGHYGEKMQAWRKWELFFTSVSISTTTFRLNSTLEKGANDEAIAYLAGNIGTGSIVPNTTILATFYYDGILATDGTLNGWQYNNIPRSASLWKKWNGTSWITASPGDIISSLQVSDTWLSRTRQSNIISTTLSLI